jgi:hypothetical protein
MAGQSATMSLSKARSMAKGAGCEMGMGSGGGSKATAPTEGRTLGDSKGKSASAGDVSGKGGKNKTKHNY